MWAAVGTFWVAGERGKVGVRKARDYLDWMNIAADWMSKNIPGHGDCTASFLMMRREKNWVFVLDTNVKMRLCYMYCTLCFA